MGKRVIVTGGAGFIGSRVTANLVRQGHEVVVYDSFTLYYPPSPRDTMPNYALRLQDVYERIRIVRGSTLNKDFLRRTVEDFRPDVIIHMAAMPLAALAIEHTEEAFQSILVSSHNILEIVRDFKHPCRVVYISSSMVYGDFQTPTVNETHPLQPKDVYGAFKLAGETVVTAYARNYGIECAIVRPSAVYGPYDTNNRVVQKFIRSALAGEPITVDGDGSMRLDFTFVEDTASGISLCAIKPEAAGGTFNITRGEGRTLAEVVEIIREELPEVRIVYRPKPHYMPQRGTLNIEAARQRLGYQPEFSIEKGVSLYLRHLRENVF